MTRTKEVAFADDLLLAIREELARALENYAKLDLGNITLWLKNKLVFNEEKSKAMMVSR